MRLLAMDERTAHVICFLIFVPAAFIFVMISASRDKAAEPTRVANDPLDPCATFKFQHATRHMRRRRRHAVLENLESIQMLQAFDVVETNLQEARCLLARHDDLELQDAVDRAHERVRALNTTRTDIPRSVDKQES